jgi:hypothetical protein
VVAAVELELASLGAHESRPGLSAACVSMAMILDRPGCVTTHPSASNQLQVLLEVLRQRSVPAGRLAAVQRMTERGGPDAG